MSDKNPPPDFAMLRAVEILAKMHERARQVPQRPPAPLGRPVTLFNENLDVRVGRPRAEVETALGVAFSYPVRGYHTYCVAGPSGEPQFLSLFYKDDAIVAAEYYVPIAENAPKLAPRSLGQFRFVPGEVALGTNVQSVPDIYVRTEAGPSHVVYRDVFEARFPGGVAYVMGRKGFVDRLALYAHTGAPEPASDA